MKVENVWYGSKKIALDSEKDYYYVLEIGSGTSAVGEPAVLAKTTSQHIVFKTESGLTIKTKIDTLNDVVGKAGKQGLFVKVTNEPLDSKSYVKTPITLY